MTINTKLVSILLVDDDEINNFISVKLIKKTLINTEIKTCLNGKFAIDLLAETQQAAPDQLPDFILLDINMPIMNGWEFLEEYERLGIDPNGKTKIYIISSSVFNNDISKAKSHTLVKDLITKPLSVDKIRDLLGILASN
jgi:CheY-like chemotaxis protein